MGVIKHLQTGTEYPLAGRVLLGRASQCLIRFQHGYVSREHAVIEHRDGRYWVKDLSPLGICINRTAIAPGDCMPIRPGDSIALGQGTGLPVLEMLSDASPRFVAHEVNLGTVVGAGPDGRLRLAREGSRVERAVISFDPATGIHVEDGAAARLLGGNMVSIGASLWMLHLPCDDRRTENLDRVPVDLRACTLIVSTDQGADFVEVSITSPECAGKKRTIVSRSRYATTLLVLAEKKLKDLEEGLPERNAGWVTNDELRSLLGCRAGEDENLPYLHPFRLKKLFEAANVRHVEPLFQREHGSLRLGVPRIEINLE